MKNGNNIMYNKQYNVLQICKFKSHSKYVHVLISQIFVLLFVIISTNMFT